MEARVLPLVLIVRLGVSRIKGRHSCDIRPAGKYQNEEGKTVCKICVAGKYLSSKRIVAMIMRMIVKFARTVGIVLPKVVLAPGVSQVNI